MGTISYENWRGNQLADDWAGEGAKIYQITDKEAADVAQIDIEGNLTRRRLVAVISLFSPQVVKQEKEPAKRKVGQPPRRRYSEHSQQPHTH